MTPYYQDEHVTLYHGDCLEIDAWLAADVLVTDPPYGMAYESGFRPTHDPIHGDKSPLTRDQMLLRWPATKPAALFGTWKVPRPPGVSQLLIWHKRGAGYLGDVKMPWGNVTEEIYVIGGGWTGPRTGNVLETDASPSADTTRIGHPTPKPVGLMERIIERAPGGAIADPFAGSGSTLLAARNLGRHAIGVEIEERYCEIAARRLAQNTLFGGSGDAA